MKRKLLALAAISAAFLLALSTSGCKKLEARDNLNKGVQSFKSAKYSAAVDFFKQAVELDPTYTTARLYLATAYMSQYIPGAESPENTGYWKSALNEFQDVLKQDPKNTTAIESIASLYIQSSQGITDMQEKVKRLDQASEWYKKLTEVEPNNKTAYYSQGFIVWAKWYPELMAARAKLGMKPEDPGPIKDKKVRLELKEKYGPMIEQGIADLKKALEIDKEYDDAMAYLNLLYRERADLADSPQEYKQDTETADMWVQKTLEAKKVKAEKAQKAGNSGIVREEEKTEAK
jgi:tetratricopeptide (TPR) repeat protein